MGFLDAELTTMPSRDGHAEKWQEWEKARPGTITRYERVLTWYRAVGEEDPDELAPNQVQDAKGQLQSASQQLAGLPRSTPATPTGASC